MHWLWITLGLIAYEVAMFIINEAAAHHVKRGLRRFWEGPSK